MLSLIQRGWWNQRRFCVVFDSERAVEPMQVVQAASRMIRNTYNISQTTIQVEEYEDEMNDCTHCQEFKD